MKRYSLLLLLFSTIPSVYAVPVVPNFTQGSMTSNTTTTTTVTETINSMDYNTGWHMSGTEISCCYIGHGLTSSISGSAAMLDLGHHARQLDVTGTLTRSKCATGSDLSSVSGFSSVNYARITSANLDAGNPPDITMMGWIKITDIGDYSYLISIATGSDGMGIAIHANSSSNGGKPYFYDNQNGSLVHDKGVNDGEWHHICGVRECSSNRKILYVDGWYFLCPIFLPIASLQYYWFYLMTLKAYNFFTTNKKD